MATDCDALNSFFNNMLRNFSNALSPIVDFLYPPLCPLCRKAVEAQSGLCVACWSQLVMPGEPSCGLCQRPFDEAVESGSICAPCMADPPRHDGIAAATLYNDTSRQLVLAFKHANKLGTGRLMARLMSGKLSFVDPQWVIVPVPLHRARLWRRGYNQAAVLAHHLSASTGARLCVDALVRRKRTPSLGGLGRKARARTLSGAIAPHPSRQGAIAGASVVLVDDVLTSGATSDACVSALKRAGAEKVVIACFARVLDEALS